MPWIAKIFFIQNLNLKSETVMWILSVNNFCLQKDGALHMFRLGELAVERELSDKLDECSTSCFPLFF